MYDKDKEFSFLQVNTQLNWSYYRGTIYCLEYKTPVFSSCVYFCSILIFDVKSVNVPSTHILTWQSISSKKSIQWVCIILLTCESFKTNTLSSKSFTTMTSLWRSTYYRFMVYYIFNVKFHFARLLYSS